MHALNPLRDSSRFYEITQRNLADYWTLFVSLFSFFSFGDSFLFHGRR
jgi:hypothetical protein